MIRAIIVCALLSGFTVRAEDPDLVEAAKHAIAYWNSRYVPCATGQGQTKAWYTVNGNGTDAGSIQMTPALNIQFRTDEISQLERLNGFEFKAASSLEQAPFRWWIAEKKLGEIGRLERLLLPSC